MKYFTLLSLIFAFTAPMIAQDKKWDVNNPQGITYKEANFKVNEGTWMCLDISPDGQTIAFDLLGDIYTLPFAGGEATCIHSGLAWEVQPRFSPDGKQILFTSDAGGGDNIWVMNADGTGAKPITKESFRLLNNATWMPDGQYIVARKHFTSTRSLGAGEIWMYHITGGDGIQLTKRKNDQQDVNEPSVSPDGRYVYFSEDMYGGGFFQYNKDPLKQITAVRRYDRQEGKTEDITGGSGGACRPQISPDGEWLAFVRRVDTQTTLFIREMTTGLEYPIFDSLDKDQQEAWTVFGVYPGFAWVPSSKPSLSKSILIWAGGKIKQVNFNTGYLADRAGHAASFSVKDIPFSCNVKTQLAETLRFENKVYEDQFTARAIRNAITSPDGNTLVFTAAGKLYKKALPNGTPALLVNSQYGKASFVKGKAENPDMLEAEPCFSPDGKEVFFVTWNDEYGGGIWRINLAGNALTQIGFPGGILRMPQVSPDGKTIVFVSQDGDDESGPSLRQKPGVYTYDLQQKRQENEPGIGTFITDEGERPQFSVDGKRILVSTGGYIFGGPSKQMLSFDLSGNDKKVLFNSKFASPVMPSPNGKWLVFTELHKAYICAMPAPGQPIDLSSDTKAFPVSPISKDAGYNMHWSGDSKKVHYILGDQYFTIDLANRFAFLPGAPDSLPPLPEAGVAIGLSLKSDAPEGTIVLKNARIITCESNLVIENGTIEVVNNKITFAGKNSDYKAGSKGKVTTIDCKGKTIMPGMVDVHSHSGNFRAGLNPQKQWEYYANLAYGVTTMHDPSVLSEMAFSNAEMLKSGRMTGPRLFSTGTILYGAEGDFKATINSLDDARSTLRRTKAWGAISVKSYNQPRREQRQQVIAAAKELGMLVVPEGGSFFSHNLTQVADGHSSIEHNIPVATLYDDVIQYWKRTRTTNTPTLIVCYGAVNGEYYWYQKEDIWKKQPLRTFIPAHILDERSRHREMIPESEYENGHILVSKTLTKMQDNGININMGSHGQLQGLGAHWELWMLQQGGMSNLQALKCATINGATHLGMDKEIGSIKTGKLADLVILDANPLDNIRNSEKINMVMVNGRIFNAATLDEIGNTPKKRGQFWFEKAGSNTGNAGMSHTCHASHCVCGH
jgi:Tol biopolymer transport system component/imidazolonepropionase-like amidohydrolase